MLVVGGTTLRVVVILFAEMREQPGGSAYDVAMREQRTESGGQKNVWAEKWEAKSRELRVEGCWMLGQALGFGP